MSMLKIVATGPESTGKTTLASQLAKHFHTIWVPEFARTYIDGLKRPYREADLLEIAKGQVALEDEMTVKAGSLLFLDTSLEVIKIWAEFRFGRCHPWILEQLGKSRHDLYLLCVPDLPWAFDPQRENPEDREELFRLYLKVLTEMQLPFQEISGAGEVRLAQAIYTITKILPTTNP